MNKDEYDAQWVCGYCGEHKVVPPLARSCEERHEAEALDSTPVAS